MQNAWKFPLACLRSCTLHLAYFLRAWGTLLFSQEVTSWFQQFLWGENYADLDQQTFERVIARYLDLYLTLAILELHRQRVMPAWEGILLVKEREDASALTLVKEFGFI